MSSFPTDVRYTIDHLWVRHQPDGDVVRVGLTDFAQESLGDIQAMTLPQVGDAITYGTGCGEVESIKSVNELIAPVTGHVRSRNSRLDQSPELANSDPYGEGWLYEVEAEPRSIPDQLARLMGAADYRRTVAN